MRKVACVPDHNSESCGLEHRLRQPINSETEFAKASQGPVDEFKSNKIIYEHQFGFQKNGSTSLAILDVQAKIIEAIEQKQIACSVFLDFAKAFDTVNHDILLDKLEHYGIKGIANVWFEPYSKNHYQNVKIGSTLKKNR